MFINTAITIGFTQAVYTFSEGNNSINEIPIIKANNQKSEITFSVAFSVSSFGNGAGAATLNTDFYAAEVQSEDFEPDEQSVSFVFELINDLEVEPTESFEVELSMLEMDLFGINVGGSFRNGQTLFGTVRVVIIDDDGML